MTPGETIPIGIRDTRIHRRAILRAGFVRSGSPIFLPDARRVTFPRGIGKGLRDGMCGRTWRLRVVFVRTFRAFLEYILPAGGSGAINITRASNPPCPTVGEGGKDDGRTRRESNSFRSQPFLTRANPLSPRVLFRAARRSRGISISAYLGRVAPHILGCKARNG